MIGTLTAELIHLICSFLDHGELYDSRLLYRRLVAVAADSLEYQNYFSSLHVLLFQQCLTGFELLSWTSRLPRHIETLALVAVAHEPPPRVQSSPDKDGDISMLDEPSSTDLSQRDTDLLTRAWRQMKQYCMSKDHSLLHLAWIARD